MKHLKLSDNTLLPADIGTETIAILGRRGSGKSNTGTVLMEELIGIGQQVVLIDPKGEGWGLKAEGQGGPGLDVIVFGEPEGDLPLREEHGETIADFVVSSGRSCVLSLSGVDSDTAARRFVARFCERLFTLKKKPENHTPLMIVLEEAHLFVPQRVEGAQADVVSRVQRLVRQGRSMGLGVTLVDQRPASVNKDVLTQIELMVCHQLTSPHDIDAVDAWIDANAEPEQAKAFRASLPKLQSGEAWLWSPAKLKLFERDKVRRRSTYDSGSTPILGKDAAKRPAMRSVDLDKLRGQLDQVVEERKANDPATLRKTIADLQKQLAEKPAAEPERVEIPVLSDEARRELTAATEAAMKLHGEVTLIYGRIRDINASAIERAEGASVVATRPAERMPSARVSDWSARSRVDDFGNAPAPAASKRSAGGKRSAGERILDAIAWWDSIDVASPSKSQVGFVAGIKPTGGHFANSIGPLSTRGLIEYVDDGVSLTRAGAKLAKAPATATTLATYHDKIRELLKSTATQSIFDAIASARGRSLSTEQIGKTTGINPSGGHFANSIGPLGTLGLITRKSGTVTPTALLFPEGLA